MPSDATLEHRLADRVRALGGPVAVAYSGGADSALVLAAAARVLGPEQVLAVTAVSESLADGELGAARRLADDLGVTPYRLARVDRAEAAVRALLAGAGLQVTDLRVRDLGDRARVEVDPALVSRTAALPTLGEALAAAGFAGLPHQVEPFRSGRLNTEP
ncbi:asparagine synthase-related protein [Streptomyces sp. IBSBF 3352]|uniref:asparagine synthase-related protein n=1 Tax=Streptomyces sp. IBSBF 3352 TaxID=2903523 RepID=UPI002FDC4637